METENDVTMLESLSVDGVPCRYMASICSDGALAISLMNMESGCQIEYIKIEAVAVYALHKKLCAFFGNRG
jgi:hypothetical protein